jgi:putative Mg2+ transporter-C (MgtC) family protein
MVNAINRAPISEHAMEAIYELRATTNADHRDAARDLVETELETAKYPVRGIAALDREPDEVELVATLVATTADPAELDQVVARLGASPLIEHASWTVRTPE